MLMFYRIKWILISIVILYLLLIPSAALFENDNFNFVVLFPVFYRLAILCIIVFSVNLLLKTTTKEQIISAVAFLIYPLSKMGVDLDSFLVRTYLTMDFVAKLDSELKVRKKNKKSLLPFILFWLESSIHTKQDRIIIDSLNRPDLLQWFIPIVLCFCYISLLFINRLY
jgi:hypothetical protein